VLNIDKNRLEDEWADNPDAHHDCGERHAEAALERDEVIEDEKEAKYELKRVEGALFLKIKKAPSQYGVIKNTDAAVQFAIPQQEEYKKALADYIEVGRRLAKKKYEVNRIEGELRGFIDRRKGLEGLTALFINKYYGTSPRIAEITQQILGDRVGEEMTRDLNEDPETEKKIDQIKKRKKV